MSRPSLDRRALGRMLTRIANGAAAPLADAEHGTAFRIGITGAPGAGKSTLTGRLALERRPRGRISVLAIDPTSRVTGGALLGDRVRMDELAGVEDIYIRSFGSRAAADGLTDHLPDLLAVMDGFGFDEVLLETVGVGQAESAVRAQVDTLVLVIPPESGDGIQAMKAGILEVADIFAVNKADIASAQRIATDLERAVSYTSVPDGGWRPRVVLTSQARPESITALSELIDGHRRWLDERGLRARHSLERSRYRLRRSVERRLVAAVDRAPPEFFGQPLARQARSILEQLLDQDDRQGSGGRFDP
jgi:LAO/AO transport system kinase